MNREEQIDATMRAITHAELSKKLLQIKYKDFGLYRQRMIEITEDRGCPVDFMDNIFDSMEGIYLIAKYGRLYWRLWRAWKAVKKFFSRRPCCTRCRPQE